VAKSKIPPPVPQSQIARVEIDGPAIRIVEEIVNDKGEKLMISASAKFDGKDYPVHGTPAADTVAYERVDTNTIKGTAKKAGKVVTRETVVVSKDGKTMMGTYSGTDAAGKLFTAQAVFERQ
jgi:hypothetical protein